MLPAALGTCLHGPLFHDKSRAMNRGESIKRLNMEQDACLTLPKRRGLCGMLRRGLSNVRLADAETEARYRRWQVASVLGTYKVCHYMLGFVFLTAMGNQYFGPVRTTMLFTILYAVTSLIWVAATVAVLWRRLWRQFSFMPQLIAACHTCMGIIIIVSTMICVGPHIATQCTLLPLGFVPGIQVVIAFACLFLYMIDLQVPWILGNVVPLFSVWLSMFMASADATTVMKSVLPFTMSMFLGILCAMVHQRQVVSRLQFHAVQELSVQVSANQSALTALDAAMQDTVTERVRALRATTFREINEAILGYVCHQIRNPLHGLQGVVDRTMQAFATRQNQCPQCDAFEEESLLILQNATAQITKVCGDVLNYQELQSGSRPLDMQSSSVSEMMEGVTKSFASMGLEYELRLDAALPAAVLVDVCKVKQMLSIGLDNAFKYRRPGTIVKVVCNLVAQSFLRFEIVNEGDGLKSLNVRQAFEPYGTSTSPIQTCAKPNSIRVFGLGLPISRLIAMQLGGEVGLEERSSLTVFWFTMPLEKWADAQPPTTPGRSPMATWASTQSTSFCQSTPISEVTNSASLPPVTTPMLLPGQITDAEGAVVTFTPETPPRMPSRRPVTELRDRPWTYWGRPIVNLVSDHCRVLVVDDLRSNRLLLSAMLRNQGHVVYDLEDGDQVLEFLRSGTVIDVCMLDIHMVRTDGRDIARALREQGVPFVLIATTGNASAPDIMSYYEAGFDGVLGKPFTSRDVEAVLTAARAGIIPVEELV